MRVLVVTHSADQATHAVTAALRARGGEPVVLHTDRFPYDHRVSLHPDGVFEVDVGDGPVVIGPDDAAWIRRLRTAEGLPRDLPEPGRRHAVEASRWSLDTLLDTLSCFVLDRRDAVIRASAKPWQYALARRAGLHLPPTLLTNDPGAAAAFLDRLDGPAITKMIGGQTVPGPDGQIVGAPTTRVDAAVRAGLDSLRLCPMQFQPMIPKAYELRVTVIGSRLFCARLDTSRADEVDWRIAGVETAHLWREHRLPDEVGDAILRLMDLTGLQYSAADFIVTPTGEHVFLEANPAGEFYWLELNPPHFPHAEAIADVLVNKPGARREIPAS